jgi:hypothetical protein
MVRDDDAYATTMYSRKPVGVYNPIRPGKGSGTSGFHEPVLHVEVRESQLIIPIEASSSGTFHADPHYRTQQVCAEESQELCTS